MKDPWAWDEDYLLAMVQAGTKESIALDFKRSEALQNTDGKKNEISKDVSAFANSAGGTLIYGISEDGYVATDLDAGSDPAEITKEWLEQVITSRIQPRIDNVRINQIYLHQKSPGRVAYVVSVPASKGIAYQASDKRFYKRFNFKSEPMEEYEIRDIYRRGETPDLRIVFTLLSPKNYIQDPPTDQPFLLRPYITNEDVYLWISRIEYQHRLHNLSSRSDNHVERCANTVIGYSYDLVVGVLDADNNNATMSICHPTEPFCHLH